MMASHGARQRAAATSVKSSTCTASSNFTNTTTTTIATTTSTCSSTRITNITTQIDQHIVLPIRKAALPSWYDQPRKYKRLYVTKLMILLLGCFFYFFYLQYRPMKRQFRRTWEKRYEYACASYVYPSPWWCNLVGRFIPRPPKLLNPSNELHYVSAKFGWPASTFQSQVENVGAALMSSGLFRQDHLHLYYDFPPFITSDARWKEHLQFRSVASNSNSNNNNNNGTAMATSTSSSHDPSRGGGYWFWKAPLLLNVLEHHAQHGDVVVYGDVDTVDHLSWLGDFIDSMIQNDHNLGIYQLDFVEGDWVKRDVFLAACSNQDAAFQEQVLSTPQYNGSLLIFRSTASLVTFLKRWEEWGSHYHWINDEASTVLPNLPTFQEHRHDQALMSLLIKCHYADADKSEFVRASMGSWSMVSMKV